MATDAKRERQHAVVWGLVLIGIGVAFLLVQFGVIGRHDLGRLWPVVLLVIGTAQATQGKLGSGLSLIMVGAWFLACTFDWMGLTYRNSWGLLLVAWGTGMVVRSLTGEDRKRRAVKEEHHD